MIDPSHTEDVDRNELDPVQREQEAWELVEMASKLVEFCRMQWLQHYRLEGIDDAEKHRFYIAALKTAEKYRVEWAAAYKRMCEARKEKQQ